MEYVYHGSKVHGLKSLTPHESTHGTYVYATACKEIAIIMSKRCGDDATYSLTTNKDGKLDLVERLPHAFAKMFSNAFSLYTLDASSFKNINTGFNEVVSEVEVTVIKEEEYSNLMDALNKLVEDNLINIYYYPNRPDYIPADDSDLIDKIRNTYIAKMHKQYTTRQLARWIFLHPNLEAEFRSIADEQGVDVPSYEEIKDRFVSDQKAAPDHEMYIDNALEMYELHKHKSL
ncbi:MAG: hypothetical protein J1F35_00720 [Erysipelotrichales bacterium]|nr:hypothetical protein [Erysipelotrichales bacterium]